MGQIGTSANDVFRDYVTAGVPGSGQHKPRKSEIRALMALVDDSIRAAYLGVAVTLFGAVGNGLDASATANTTAIQAAIDSLPVTGGAVFFPPGVYVCKDIKINGTNRDKARVLLIGTEHSHLRLPSGTSAANLIDMAGAVDCGVSRLLLNGNRQNITLPGTLTDPDYEKWNVVYAPNANGCFVVDCQIANAPIAGVMCGAPHLGVSQFTNRFKVMRNTITGCNVGVTGMRQYQNIIADNHILDSLTYAAVLDEYSSQSEIYGNVVQGAGNDAIYLFRAPKCAVCENTISTTTSVAVSADDDADDCLIAGNLIIAPGNTGILLTDASDRILVTGNQIVGAAQWGVASIVGQSSAGAFQTIVANKISGCGYGGIANISSAVCDIRANSIHDCNGSGVYLEGAGSAGSTIAGNTCVNNSRASTVDAGIRLKDAQNVRVVDNHCTDTQATKTQKWGIRADEGCTNLKVRRNDLSGNLTAGLVISGTGHRVSGNDAYVTENGGTASITYPGATSVTVTHGLSYTPSAQDISVTLASGLNSGNAVGVDTITATTFRIFLTQTPSSGTYYFAWRAAPAAG